MTFQKGQSGNPAGRPPGARGKAALLVEALSANDAHEIIRAAIDKAKDGDIAAVRFCLDRIAPRPKDTAVDYELPKLHNSESALSAVADIAAAVGRGALTPAQADNLTRVVDRFVRAYESLGLEQRVIRLEHRHAARPQSLPPPMSKPSEFALAADADAPVPAEPGTDWGVNS
jgi:hypothetical protein